ncbi:MAG: ribulose-phosphate 3-epimerase [Halobacteriovoraceae bacterium]|nr:ribulose-phosphate 3-epimerase [Halobacteriovoraceae bacterium]MBC99668.1 ribulose-phosphate 3-epimerase [Halobacteriovoraceae bacterium]|tara:strand:- start:5 stop:661 length:657 start_codon:yes stop_codon:yes gene_type:complete
MLNLVSPSILSCDFMNIQSDLAPFEGTKDLWMHLDIMDGHFVPNLTFGIPIIKQISKICSVPLDAHLMVTNPKFHIDEMKDFGLANITFHYEAVEDALALTQHAKKFYPSVGISIKPNTDISSLSEELLRTVDLILVMSVEPGFGGQSFIENSYEKIYKLHELRNKNQYTYQIQVDGGVSDANAKKLREHGADNLVAGSFIFKKEKEQYLNLVESLRS